MDCDHSKSHIGLFGGQRANVRRSDALVKRIQLTKFRSSGGRKRRTTIDEEDDVVKQTSGLRSSSSWSASKSPLKARKRSSAPKLQSEIVHSNSGMLGLKDLSQFAGEGTDALALSPRADFLSSRSKENTEYTILEELYAMDSANRFCADCSAECKSRENSLKSRLMTSIRQRQRGSVLTWDVCYASIAAAFIEVWVRTCQKFGR